MTISNILTLRYDPLQKPLLPKLSWKSFGNNTPSIELIEKSIKNTIQSVKNPKSISIALSGGVDSTLILMFLRKTLPDVKIEAISIKFADSVDETKSAAKIANHFNANHHIVELDNYLDELPKAISIVKLPFWDLHWYYVVKKSQSLSKHLASGDGGDEVFGGYTFRYKKFLSLINKNSAPLDKVKAYLECHERDRVPDQEKLFAQKSQFKWESIYDMLIPYFDNSLSAIDQVLLADYNGKLLYNFSLVNTKLHDHFDLQSIAPLLSKDLISYMVPISNEFKYDSQNNIGKLLLRKLLKIHNADSLVANEKLGFNVNTLNLWQSRGKQLCSNYLLNARIVKDGWINQDWIDHHITKNDLDVRYVNKFLGLLAFEIWYRIFITKEMKADTRLE
jgi:asparagine synthase (glutamine-hydrolysing)